MRASHKGASCNRDDDKLDEEEGGGDGNIPLLSARSKSSLFCLLL